MEYYQRLVRALGFRERAESAPSLAVATTGVARPARRQLRGAGWDGRAPLVALAPGAAYWRREALAAGVTLPSSLRALAEDGVRAVHGRQPRQTSGTARSRWPRRPARTLPLLNLDRRTDLPTLAGVLAHCRALVSNDSGAMHLAAALGVRVTAVFGPTDERVTSAAGDAHVRVDQPGVVPALHAARVPDRSPLHARHRRPRAVRPADVVSPE